MATKELATVTTASVSVLDMFARWQHSPDETWQEFVDRLAAPQTPQMAVGQSFHRALESCHVGNHNTLTDDNNVFNFSEFEGEISLGQVREVPCSKKYGNLLVRGRVDSVFGATITDYKLTFSSFDAEKFLESYQWRFYLDMLVMNTFEYRVFEAYENTRTGEYDVRRLHSLRLYRYLELTSDCEKLAKKFYAAFLNTPQIAKTRELDEL